MGSRKGLGYPSESDPSDSEVNAGDLTTAWIKAREAGQLNASEPEGC